MGCLVPNTGMMKITHGELSNKNCPELLTHEIIPKGQLTFDARTFILQNALLPLLLPWVQGTQSELQPLLSSCSWCCLWPVCLLCYTPEGKCVPQGTWDLHDVKLPKTKARDASGNWYLFPRQQLPPTSPHSWAPSGLLPSTVSKNPLEEMEYLS